MKSDRSCWGGIFDIDNKLIRIEEEEEKKEEDEDLDESKDLDPHFSKDNTSPIARFIPTDEGWNMANDFAIELNLDIMFGEL